MESASTKIQCPETPSTACGSARPARPPKRQPPLEHFDAKNPWHKERLRTWCQQEWPATFRKSLQSSNAISFHECCCSFSRRQFARFAGHPPLQSAVLTKMPSFREVCSAEDLYHWMLGRLLDNAKRGLPSYFPLINRVHQELVEVDADDLETEVASLRKRVEAISSNEERLARELKTLRDDNEKLLLSTKTWYGKYQDLLDRQEKMPSAFTTPLKRGSKTNFDVLEDVFYYLASASIPVFVGLDWPDTMTLLVALRMYGGSSSGCDRG